MMEIKTILKQIEFKYGVKILYACETGSRAWGFPSPDSDYDIRFIYRHERDWYLNLNTPKDTIEFMDGDLDITGWDLKKSLKLLKKSNVPLIERFQSPIQYYADEKFKADFVRLIQDYYSPMASFFHHYSLASKFWEEIKDQSEIKLKNYFYLIRSLLSCNWIVKNHEVLPMHMGGLLELINKIDKTELLKLVELKSMVGEKYLHPKNEKMQAVAENLFSFINSAKDGLDVNNQDYFLLNEFFIKTLNAEHDN
jgi:predicted nucleotidyltransferase